MVKNLPANAGETGDVGSIPGSGRCPGEMNGYPLQYSRLENPVGQSSLAGYCSWGYKQLDMTEPPTFAYFKFEMQLKSFIFLMDRQGPADGLGLGSSSGSGLRIFVVAVKRY